jgi:hypothetical protein
LGGFGDDTDDDDEGPPPLPAVTTTNTSTTTTSSNNVSSSSTAWVWEPGVRHAAALIRSPQGLGIKLEEREGGVVYCVGASTGSPAENALGSSEALQANGFLRITQVSGKVSFSPPLLPPSPSPRMFSPTDMFMALSVQRMTVAAAGGGRGGATLWFKEKQLHASRASCS